jgi:hypothetical protein
MARPLPIGSPTLAEGSANRTGKEVTSMDQKDTRTVAQQIEDLPVDAEQAAEVKGGQDFHYSASSEYLSAGVIKAFNPQPDPPKTL